MDMLSDGWTNLSAWLEKPASNGYVMVLSIIMIIAVHHIDKQIRSLARQMDEVHERLGLDL